MYIIPEDVFEKDYLIRFNRISTLLNDSLEKIDINRYIVNRIRRYPIYEILNEYPIVFSSIFNNSIEICMLTFSKLITDNSNNFITLSRFKKEIKENLVDSRVRNIFEQEYKETHRKYKISEIKEKVRSIRNRLIAHNDNILIDLETTVDNILWSDFDTINEYLHSMVKLLIFGQNTLYINTFAYHPQIDITPRPVNDFDKIIELIENSSQLVNGLIEYDINREIFLENHKEVEIDYMRKILERKGYENLI